MSVYQKFANTTTALEAFAAGKCRRFVSIDGWMIDLVRAANPVKVSRPDDDHATALPTVAPPTCPYCRRSEGQS